MPVTRKPRKPDVDSNRAWPGDGADTIGPTSYSQDQIYAPASSENASKPVSVIWPAFHIAAHEILANQGKAAGVETFAKVANTASFHSLHSFLGPDAQELRHLRLEAAATMQAAVMRSRQETLDELVSILKSIMATSAPGGREQAEILMERAFRRLAAVTYQEHREWFVESVGRELDQQRWVEQQYRKAARAPDPYRTTGGPDYWNPEGGYNPESLYLGSDKGNTAYGDPLMKSVRMPLNLLDDVRDFIRSGRRKEIKLLSQFLRNATHHYIYWLMENDLAATNLAHQFTLVAEAIKPERQMLRTIFQIRDNAREARRHQDAGRPETAKAAVSTLQQELRGMSGFWAEMALEVVTEQLARSGLWNA